jgi:hypothetical protein
MPPLHCFGAQSLWTVHVFPLFPPPTQRAQLELMLHALPLKGPPRHRRPPQIVAPTAVQSALDMHGVAAALLHVSQKHLWPAELRQTGFAAESVTVCVPVS